MSLKLNDDLVLENLNPKNDEEFLYNTILTQEKNFFLKIKMDINSINFGGINIKNES